MNVCRAYKFKLKTNEELEQKFFSYAGCCRFVWNKALALIKLRLDHYIPTPTWVEMNTMITFWKKTDEFSFLKEAPAQILQQSIKDLYKAINAGFKKGNGKRLPKFRKKSKAPDSFRYPQHFKFKDNKIYLPKIGWIRFYKSRVIEGKPKSATIKRFADGWYIIIVVEQELNVRKNKSNQVGIDVGVRKLATLSNGYYFKPLDLSKKEKKIIKLQRRLARKQPGSNNRRKYREKLAKAHRDLVNAREDYLHKVSTAIAKNHGVVAVEDLKIKNMTKSAKGTIENPGRNVKAKAGLNRSISFQAWYKFFNMLDYKLKDRGGELVKVPPENTSKTCPVCGCIHKDNRKSQATFLCSDCGFTANADLVGAINILRELGNEIKLPQGLREVTPVEYVRVHTMKQEPVGTREEVPLQMVA